MPRVRKIPRRTGRRVAADPYQTQLTSLQIEHNNATTPETKEKVKAKWKKVAQKAAGKRLTDLAKLKPVVIRKRTIKH